MLVEENGWMGNVKHYFPLAMQKWMQQECCVVVELNKVDTQLVNTFLQLFELPL